MAKDILQFVQQQEKQACRNNRRGCIICPGAIGDCLLTLPLAAFMKSAYGLGGIDFIGRTEYIDFYPGRTAIDGIRSLESIHFHRLFQDAACFTVEEHDELVLAFAAYERIVSFMGFGDPHFESNFIFAANCTRSADVALLPMADSAGSDRHVSDFYISAYSSQDESLSHTPAFDPAVRLVKPHARDAEQGRQILESLKVDSRGRLAVIHPGSGGRSKCWHIQNFKQVAARLIGDGIQVLFLCGPAEIERIAPDIRSDLADLAPFVTGTSLTALLQILAWADGYLGNDSGISHLAGAMGIPTVAVFGPTDPRKYRPLGPRVQVVTASASSFVQPAVKDVEIIHEVLARVVG